MSPYIIRHKRGTKNIRLRVRSNGQVIITAPKIVPKSILDRFVIDQADWIKETKIRLEKRHRPLVAPPGMQTSYTACKARALKLVKERIAVLNTHYGFSFAKITIKNQSAKWGSCSSKRNLNFNYRLLFLPETLVDYIVVHELCHLKYMNHSLLFWKLVAETIPDYRRYRQELRQYHW